MPNKNTQKQRNNVLINVAIVLLCVGMVALDWIEVRYVSDDRRNVWISRMIQHSFGIFASILLLKRINVRLFGRPQAWLCALPCILIAVNNFPFWSYFAGNMRFERISWLDFLLFAGYCLSIGLFEELVFRGFLFFVFASLFSSDRKGLLKTVVVTSVLFGGMHLFNLFFGAGVTATLLQVGYSVLTGGLFAVALIKTKSLLVPAVLHAVYNFCGLLLSPQGLGEGIVFDLGTYLTMGAIALLLGVYVLCLLLKYPENERKTLYTRLGIRENP